MYKHGAFADINATKDYIPPSGVGTLPVYFGTAPVNQLKDYSNTKNQPILLQSYDDAVNKIGYSEDWDNFTLCEAVYAHFLNSLQPIGPIVVINAIDPNTQVEANQSSTVTMTNSIGYLEDPLTIINTIEIEGKTLGTDYEVEFSKDGSKVKIVDLSMTLGTSVEVTYSKLNLSTINKEAIEELIPTVNLIYQKYNMIPTILAAPGWSNDKDINNALKLSSQKINGHWYAYVNSDIECDENTNTIELAINKKKEDNYTSSIESPCWPMAYKEDKKLHLSTLATVTMQFTDYLNDNVPVETPSNKVIDIDGLCLKDGTVIEFDQIQANELNSKGIRTATFWGGRWVLWGSHTGEYEYGLDIDPRNIFDSSVRMLHYIANVFQLRYGNIVDQSFNRALKDTILNDMQEWLDTLIAQGKLLHATISFNEISNPVSDMVEGDFIFDISTTTTPPAKSLTAKITYIPYGLNVLFGGE